MEIPQYEYDALSGALRRLVFHGGVINPGDVVAGVFAAGFRLAKKHDHSVAIDPDWWEGDDENKMKQAIKVAHQIPGSVIVVTRGYTITGPIRPAA